MKSGYVKMCEHVWTQVNIICELVWSCVNMYTNMGDLMEACAHMIVRMCEHVWTSNISAIKPVSQLYFFAVYIIILWDLNNVLWESITTHGDDMFHDSVVYMTRLGTEANFTSRNRLPDLSIACRKERFWSLSEVLICSYIVEPISAQTIHLISF